MIVGEYAMNLGEDAAAKLLAEPSVQRIGVDEPVAPLVRCETHTELGDLGAVSVHELGGALAVHLLNYDYREDLDAVHPREQVDIVIPFAGDPGPIRLHRPGVVPQDLAARLASAGQIAITVPSFKTYAVVTIGAEK